MTQTGPMVKRKMQMMSVKWRDQDDFGPDNEDFGPDNEDERFRIRLLK